MLIDTHCHFDFEAFDKDRAALWQCCQDAGLGHLIMPGVCPQQWPSLKVLCKAYKGLHHALGIHPWWLATVLESGLDEPLGLCREQILASAAEQSFVAVGECGLDTKIATPLSVQIKVLQWHCELACELELPLILHCVKAHNPMLQCLNAFPSLQGVLHGFSGSYELAQSYWQRGFLLGIGGTITYPRAAKTRETARKMPIESLILETDAPDMPLQGRQGEANSPVYLPELAKALAVLRDENYQALVRQTTANAKHLFTRL